MYGCQPLTILLKNIFNFAFMYITTINIVKYIKKYKTIYIATTQWPCVYPVFPGYNTVIWETS